MNIWDMQVEGGEAAELQLIDGHTAWVVVQSGTMQVNGDIAEGVACVEIDRAETPVQIRAETRARLLILTGEPIDEPVVGQGPFVMNTREGILTAMQDFQQGRMGRLSEK